MGVEIDPEYGGSIFQKRVKFPVGSISRAYFRNRFNFLWGQVKHNVRNLMRIKNSSIYVMREIAVNEKLL
jgi:hypothetical protein